MRLSGYYTPETRLFQGDGQLPDATPVKWRAKRQEVASQRRQARLSQSAPKPVQLGSMIYPFAAYGRAAMPQQETVLIKNATVWTSEAAGKLENTDVLLVNGKISKIGKNLTLPKMPA